MHKSRLGAIVLDCRTNDLDQDARFWGRVLGYEVQGVVEPGNERYRELTAEPGEPNVLLQSVDHPSRVHLDIETDDVEAEVQRLEGLGATRVEKIRAWWVMEAPTGHRFCVVPPQRSDFETGATVWGED